MSVPYTLKQSKKAKNLRIIINRNAEVSVVMPKGLDIKIVEGFLAKKSAWIQSKIALFQKNKQLMSPPPLPTGFSRTDYHSCVARARKLVKDRLAELNSVYQFDFERVSIKQQSTLWGSCSAKKNLNFNYKIVLLPPHLADYIIVHELCHLKELNHSKQFWQLVEQVCPNHRAMRRELRQYELASL